METCPGLLKQPAPPAERLSCVLVVEDSCPTCPAELGKGLLDFIRALATNNLLYLYEDDMGKS